ncbi:MAG: F0F1 ATP synthase subunit A [Chloroflexi bacterium]|nr:F0F1 ATP synthase subunit A [Chloroflexota bacterium]
MKLVYIVVAIAALGGWLAVGLLFAQGPQPEIVVPAEVLTKLGPLNITNTMLTAWIVMAMLIVFSFVATRSMKLMPSGIQNFFEAIIGFLLAQMEEIAGEKNARKFFAVVATIFLFVIVSNWFGLMPFFNAIGKTEDVGHEIFHELASPEPEKLTLAADGTYEEKHKFAGWKMDDAGGMVVAKSGAKAVDFEVEVGETPGQALDRYIVFLAKEFAGFEIDDEALHHPTAEQVAAAAATLDGTGAPLLMMAEGHDEHAQEGHGLESPALHATIAGVDFEDSQKMALVIPFFRGVYSDINNTLALGIIAFFMIEFWGFQALGFGYLKKFFNLNGINSFVGILELLSEFIRIISFAFRLFGNIFAGEVLILMLTFLMPFLFVDIIYGLELFVGFIQASVFALLTLVFATMAVEHHGEEDHHGDDHHDEDAAADAHYHPGAAQAH